jgi:hypothetical protein
LLWALAAAALAPSLPVRADERFTSADYQPMTFVLGRYLATDGCGRDCADFIVARGHINPSSYFQMLIALRRASPRKLPIVIHSPGGFVGGGTDMAGVLKLEGHDVLVAKATPADCQAHCTEADRAAGVLPYVLDGNLAECSSACAMMIAGAGRIVVPAGARIGVHMPTVDKGKLPNFASDRMREQAVGITYDMMAAFYARMEIAPGIMAMIRETPNDDMRYLTVNEMKVLRFRVIDAPAAPQRRQDWASVPAVDAQRP